MKKFHTKCKILLIEINESAAELAKSEIKKQIIDAEFCEITSEKTLFSELGEFRPEVIIFDPAKPETGQLLSDISYLNQQGDIPLIIFTSSANEELAYKYLDKGAWDYIPKEDARRLIFSLQNAIDFYQAQKEVFLSHKDLDEFEAYVKRFRDWELHIPAIVYSYILKTDGTQYFTYLSSATKKYLGISPEEIVKDSSIMKRFMLPEDINGVLEKIEISAQKLIPFELELRLIINGEIRWFKFFSSPERNNNNETIWSGIIVDITERKNMAEALSSEQYLMHILMDNSPDAIYFKDLDSRFITVNKAYLNKVGLESEEDIIGKTDFDIFDEEHAKSAKHDEETIIKTGKPVIDKLEKEIYSIGKVTWVSSTKVPLRNAEGIITGTFGISRDITERKMTEESLYVERNLLRMIIDAIPDLIYIKDKNEKIIIANKAHIAFLGKEDQTEVYGKATQELLPLKNAEKLHKEDQLVLSGTSVYNSELNFKNKNGKDKYYISTKLPLRNSNNEITGFVGISHDVTESRQIQEKIRKSEEQIRYIISSTSSVLFNAAIKDDEFTFIWISENVKDLLGYLPADVMKAGWWEENIHPDDKDFFENSLPSLYKGKRLSLEFRLQHAEKHYVWVSTELNYTEDTGKKQPAIIGSWIDITERMMAQEALLKSEEQLSYALKIARLAYWEYDIQEKFFILNEQFYSVFGITEDNNYGPTISTEEFINYFIHPEDAKDFRNLFFSTVSSTENKNGRELEFRRIDEDGRLNYYQFFIFTSSGKNKKAIKAFGVVQDITERKQNINVIKDSRKKLSNAMKIAHLAYWEYDYINDLFIFNDQFYDLLKTKAIIEGGYIIPSSHYAKKFVHPDDIYVVREEIRKSAETRDPNYTSYLEHRIIYGNGEIGHIAVRFSIVKDKYGRTIKSFGANQDITERVKREMEKRELEKQLLIRNQELQQMLDDMTRMQKTLVQSEKMASLGELSAGIAHEINNPLSYVCSNVNRLKEYFDDTTGLLQKWQNIEPQLYNNGHFNKILNEINDYSKMIDLDFILQDFGRMMVSIQDGTERIKKIVEGMRGFAHISENSMQFADINKAIEDTLTIVWNEVKYKAAIEKEYGELPPVKCNISEIKQVLVNLLVNASHAINEKGMIKIITSSEFGYATIKISDNGCGIPEDKLKRIFDPFYTTKPVGKGTGLGLWISSTIIQKHNGFLTVESKPDFGSTFTIRIPIENSQQTSGKN